MESLESRLVLAAGILTGPPPGLLPDTSAAPSSSGSQVGLTTYPLAHGGTALVLDPGARGGAAASSQAGPAGLEAAPGIILAHPPVASPFAVGPGSADFAASGDYSPAQITTAYGINQVSFGNIKGDGAGQTIGIFAVGYNPAFLNSTDPNYNTDNDALYVFDQKFSLPAPASITFFDEDGNPLSPTNNSSNNSDFDNYHDGDEIALDIEWAHAIAPAAAIDVLCASPFAISLPTGMETLAGMPGVTVVSVSYGVQVEGSSGGDSAEQSWDSTYLQAAVAAHPNVSFFAGSGDAGSKPGLLYPSASPEVVSVGGTSLYLTSSNQRASELGWDGSGGGYSQAFALPVYQQNDGFSGNSKDQRTNPDVAADADPETGVEVYDPFDFGGWDEVGGTSLATPLWAGMAAIADQGRLQYGGQPLGATAMLNDLYSLQHVDANAFYDVAQGNNGYPAGPGYDLVTGLGAPNGERLISDLSTLGLPSQAAIATQPPPTVVAGDPFGIVAEAALPNGAINHAFDGTATLSLRNGPAGASFAPVTVSFSYGVAVFSGVSLNQLSQGADYVFNVALSGGLASTTTGPVNVVAATAGVANYYPLPFDSNDLGGAYSAYSPRSAIDAADADTDASSIIALSISSLPYDVSDGEFLIENLTSDAKSIAIAGQGASNSIIDANNLSRAFEIDGTGQPLDVMFQGLAIEGGQANSGAGAGANTTTGPPTASGGGLLIEGGSVTLSGVSLANNRAIGLSRSSGSGGAALGGGIYMSSGNLALIEDRVQGNEAQGGDGGPFATGGAARGGGIYVSSGSLVLRDDQVSDNTVVGGAGGDGTSHHLAAGAGGEAVGAGLLIASGPARLDGVAISGNTARGGQGGQGAINEFDYEGAGGAGGAALGGGIASGPGPLVLDHATITDNQLQAGRGGDGGDGGEGGMALGGGIYGPSGSLTLDHSVIADDQARGGQGGTGYTTSRHGNDNGRGGLGGNALGGGIYTKSGSLTLNNSTVADDQVFGGQGGIGYTTFSEGPGGNGADGGNAFGGGIYSESGSLTLDDSTIADDQLQEGPGGPGGKGFSNGRAGLAFGGGVYDSGPLTFQNVTVADNPQGGVYQAGGAVAAFNTLFADNGYSGGPGASGADYTNSKAGNGTANASNSLFGAAPVGVATDGTDLVGVDAKIGALADNGGPTQTIALQSGSPAIGAGQNPINGVALFTDQRGYVVPDLSHWDIGAYQTTAQPAAAPTAKLSAPNVSVSDYGQTSYTFTITYASGAGIAPGSLAGAAVTVTPPAGVAPGPIAAAVVSTTANGPTDPFGDAQSYSVTYSIAPPGGQWGPADDGTYSVNLGGAPIEDADGQPVPTGTLGTFDVGGAQAVQMAIFKYGLVPNRRTGGWSGRIVLTNTASSAVSGPIFVVFNLPSGAVLENATGAYNGVPYLEIAAGAIPAGGAIVATVTFNQRLAAASYSTSYYLGSLGP